MSVARVNQHRIGYLENGQPYIVNLYTVCGIDEYAILDVYEPSAIMGAHRNITSFTGVNGVSELGVRWWGMVGSRRIGPEIERLAGGSAERIAMVKSHYKIQHELARRMALNCFPEFVGRLSDDMLNGQFQVHPQYGHKPGAVEQLVKTA